MTCIVEFTCFQTLPSSALLYDDDSVVRTDTDADTVYTVLYGIVSDMHERRMQAENSLGGSVLCCIVPISSVTECNHTVLYLHFILGRQLCNIQHYTSTTLAYIHTALSHSILLSIL